MKIFKKEGKCNKSSDSRIENLAKEVINGKFGNGQTRKDLLGDDYQEVQNKVNEMVKEKTFNKRRHIRLKVLFRKKRPGDIFYEDRMKAENWPRDDICDPPTDPRIAIHALIDHFLGEDWYVVMPESDDQVITVAVAEIMDKYPHPKK